MAASSVGRARLKALENENARLKKLLASATRQRDAEGHRLKW